MCLCLPGSGLPSLLALGVTAKRLGSADLRSRRSMSMFQGLFTVDILPHGYYIVKPQAAIILLAPAVGTQRRSKDSRAPANSSWHPSRSFFGLFANRCRYVYGRCVSFNELPGACPNVWTRGGPRMASASLNRRHKAALFATLVITGIALVNGERVSDLRRASCCSVSLRLGP